MERFEIKNRWTGEAQFACDLETVADETPGQRLGRAVLKAIDAGAYLRGANLRGANLRDAYLRGADLRDADLSGADLSGAKDIPEEWLAVCRDDVWSVLSSAPSEVRGLREALASGRVDGSTYEGDCACLVGTIANLRGESYLQLGTLKPNSRRPAEQWFMGIRRGDVPETNEFSRHAITWVDQWIDGVTAAFGPKP